MRFLPRIGGSRETTNVSKATETGIPDDAGKKIVKWGTFAIVAMTIAACVLVGRFRGIDAMVEFIFEWWHVPTVAWLLLWPAAGAIVIVRMGSEIWYKNHPTHAQLNSSRLMGPLGWSKKEHDEYDKRAAHDAE